MIKVFNPYVIRDRLRHHAGAGEDEPVSDGARGSITGKLNKSLRWSGYAEDEKTTLRRLVLGWVFGDSDAPMAFMSSKDLTNAQWYGLWQWIGAHKIEGKWHCRPAFDREMQGVCKLMLLHRNTARTIEQDNGGVERVSIAHVFEVLSGKYFIDEKPFIMVAPGSMVDTAVQLGAVLIEENTE